jgi:hypothetical protein
LCYGSNYWRRSKRTRKTSLRPSKKKKLGKSQSNEESFYDLDFDWDIIVSSFLQQYGIRLNYEYDTISYTEFNQLLRGINGDTPLGYTVQVRAETDQKKIREMTAHEKKIRQEWKDFKSKQQKQNVVVLSKDEIDKVLSNMFR